MYASVVNFTRPPKWIQFTLKFMLHQLNMHMRDHTKFQHKCLFLWYPIQSSRETVKIDVTIKSNENIKCTIIKMKSIELDCQHQDLVFKEISRKKSIS